MTIPVKVKKQGLYCPSGDFFVDAWGPVPLCLVTHAHGDHAYAGHGLMIAAEDSLELLQYRLKGVNLKTYPYGEKFKVGECWVSFHPAGHILGSAQIRIETKDKVCVISGDYKRAADSTCQPFEVVKGDIFITESTFALPIYHWEESLEVAKKIYDWWLENASQDIASVCFCYSLGKAQRILSLLSTFTDTPIYAHGAILPITEIYAKKGVKFPPFLPISEKRLFAKELILAPPSAKLSPWMKRFYPCKTALASGWMAVRGMRKQRNVDTGFVLSDHADWPNLLKTIVETEAKTVLTTHGNTEILARYLQEQGFDARTLKGLESPEEELD